MSKLRKEARGRECQIRIPNCCNGDSSTVVLCHLPGAGVGRKHNDLFGAWGCSACHDVVDGRRKTDYQQEVLRLWLFEAVVRTQQALVDEGVIHA